MESIIIILDDFDVNNIFKTKSSKQNFKNTIRKIYNVSDNINNFETKFNDSKNEFINKYLNTPHFYYPKLEYNISQEADTHKINIKLEYIENTEAINRAKLHNRIREIREENTNIVNLYNIEKYNKKELKNFKRDKRVDNNMINLYYKTKKIIKNDDILNPIQILNDIDTAKQKYYKYLENAISQSNPNTQYVLLKNTYTEYMSLMTNTPIKIPNEILSKLNI